LVVRKHAGSTGSIAYEWRRKPDRIRIEFVREPDRRGRADSGDRGTCTVWELKAPIQEALYSSASGKVTKLRHGHNALQPEEDGSGPIKGTTPTRFRQPLAVCRSSPLFIQELGSSSAQQENAGTPNTTRSEIARCRHSGRQPDWYDRTMG